MPLFRGWEEMESLRRPFFSRTEKKKKRTGDERKKRKKKREESGSIRRRKGIGRKTFFHPRVQKNITKEKKISRICKRLICDVSPGERKIGAELRVVAEWWWWGYGIKGRGGRARRRGVDEGSLLAATFILLFVGWWKISFPSFCSYPWLFWLVFR